MNEATIMVLMMVKVLLPTSLASSEITVEHIAAVVGQSKLWKAPWGLPGVRLYRLIQISTNEHVATFV